MAVFVARFAGAARAKIGITVCVARRTGDAAVEGFAARGGDAALAGAAVVGWRELLLAIAVTVCVGGAAIVGFAPRRLDTLPVVAIKLGPEDVTAVCVALASVGAGVLGAPPTDTGRPLAEGASAVAVAAGAGNAARFGFTARGFDALFIRAVEHRAEGVGTAGMSFVRGGATNTWRRCIV